MPREFWIAALLVVFMLPPCRPAQAEAWTLPEHSWQIINTATLYRTDRYYDANGTARKQEPLLKREFNPHIEYGLDDRTTLGANLFFQYLSTQGAFAAGTPPPLSRKYYGAEAELFLRRKIFEQDGWVFSLQPLVKLPGQYWSESSGASETSPLDAELSALAGKGFTAGGYEQFISGSVAYRARFSTPADQAKLNVTWGIHLTPAWMILAQGFATYGIGDTDNARFTSLGQDDYDLVKLQLSAVYRFNRTYALQFGGFGHVLSRNTGGGGGALAAIWVNF